MKNYLYLSLLGLLAGSLSAKFDTPPQLDGPVNTPLSTQLITEPVYEKSKAGMYAISYSQYPVVSSEAPFNSIAALKNGFVVHAQKDNTTSLEQELQSTRYEEALYGTPEAPWSKNLATFRPMELVANFIHDMLLKSLAGGTVVPAEDICPDCVHYSLSDGSVVQFPSNEEPEAKTMRKLIHGMAPHIGAYIAQRELYILSKKELFELIETLFGSLLSQEEFDKTARLKDIALQVHKEGNKYLLTNHGTVVATNDYGQEAVGLPSFCTDRDLYALSIHETKNPSVVFKQSATQPKLILIDETANDNLKLFQQLTQTIKVQKTPLDVMLLLQTEQGSRYTINLHTSHNSIQLIITDPTNESRMNAPLVRKLKYALNKGLKDSAPVLVGQQHTKEDEDEKINYDAPLAHIPLEELETLEDLFGGKIPNELQVIMHMMKHPALNTNDASSRIKNCIILHGPPGTGKSTIAQVLPRMCGWDVVYAGGGDFRTAYQGSGKAKIDAFFAEVDARGKAIAFIDEVDGTTSKTGPQGSTQEDVRTVRAFQTAIDQRRHNTNAWTIFTTNHLDQIDDAFRRRCIIIKVPLPSAASRKRIMTKYCNKLGIPVQSGEKGAISPRFFETLVAATEGFSGDRIIDMIANAKLQYDAGLTPDTSIAFSWRFQGINFTQRSLLANLGEALLVPLAPVFHTLSDSPLETHLYAQYARHIKEQKAVEELAWHRDPRNSNKNYSWSRSALIMGRQGLKTIIHGILSHVGSSLASKVKDSVMGTDWKQLIANYRGLGVDGNEG